jgi:hypothetical protein
MSRRTLKNAVNARTDTEPKATPPKNRKTKFCPFLRNLDKNQTTLPRLPISAKQEEERKQPRKKICAAAAAEHHYISTTLAFSRSLCPSVPPSLPMFFIVNFVM